MSPEPPPRASKKRRRRPRRPKPEAPAALDSAGRDVVTALDKLVLGLARELGAPPPDVAIDLPLVVGPPSSSVPERSARLVAGLRARIEEAVKGASAFREGHVYCFFTDAPESPYSRPPSVADVFAGYSGNGRPEWIGFANLCLLKKEPRVDRLFADPPEIAAIVQMHDELTDGLEPGFGRGSLAYRLVGQVSFGFVPRGLDLRHRGDERVAVTLQVVATRLGTSAERLRLNVLGLSVPAIAEAAARADASSPAEAFRRVLRGTRERVDALGRKMTRAQKAGEPIDVDAEVRAVLGRLRGDLLRVFKSRDYRTRHAEERHQSGERPTSLAIADALAATDGRFFRDEHKDTVVVAGPRHRVHVFSRDGRHVTSLDVLPAELERRVDRGRWRPLERLAAEVFKEALRRSRSDRSAGE